MAVVRVLTTAAVQAKSAARAGEERTRRRTETETENASTAGMAAAVAAVATGKTAVAVAIAEAGVTRDPVAEVAAQPRDAVGRAANSALATTRQTLRVSSQRISLRLVWPTP